MRAFRLLVLITLALLAVAPRAFGHGERTSSDPKPGASLQSPPSAVSVDFSEPPTGSAVLRVLDGCGRDVVDDLTVQDLTVSATLAEGQPGAWRVGTRIISGLDGHATRDGFKFSVEGTPDCSQAAPTTDDDGETGGDSDDGGSGMGMILAVGAGSLVLAAIAVALRRGGSKAT